MLRKKSEFIGFEPITRFLYLAKLYRYKLVINQDTESPTVVEEVLSYKTNNI